jgi:hypothetical protein
MKRDYVKRDQSALRNHVSRFIGVTTPIPVEPGDLAGRVGFSRGSLLE